MLQSTDFKTSSDYAMGSVGKTERHRLRRERLGEKVGF